MPAFESKFKLATCIHWSLFTRAVLVYFILSRLKTFPRNEQLVSKDCG